MTITHDQLHCVLVSMPFQDARRPSLQLGLLKAVGRAAGFPVETLHANLDFEALIGSGLYSALCEHRGRLVGDWLFSGAAFGIDAPDPDGRLLEDFGADLAYLGADLDRLLLVRNQLVPAYLDRLTEALDWDSVSVVGFTSTFQQTTASLALARCLKRRWPTLVTVFGGANFDAPMGLELLRAIADIDYAVVGEADVSFPLLLASLANAVHPPDVAGVAARTDSGIRYTPADSINTLDELPVPDYTEYFRRRDQLGLGDPSQVVALPFESARGCWWGAKHHCTFCGLNGTSMTFRAKSPHRVALELAEQAQRYQTFYFEAVDNILDPRYLTSILRELSDNELDYDLFYEVKANLTRRQIQALAKGGVRRVQPGIESLSSHVLALMNKGVRASQNVNLLRWARYYGIEVSWNLLWGFPGETPEDYDLQAATIPHLVHLQPPDSVGRVWLERFSPMFTDELRFPTRYRRPEASYAYVYPAVIDLGQIAYFFDYEFSSQLPAETDYAPMREAANDWREAWHAPTQPELSYRSSPSFLQIYDARRPGKECTHTLKGDLARIYRAISDRPTTATAVCEELGRYTPEDVSEVFAEWATAGLLFLDDDRALALALPATPGR